MEKWSSGLTFVFAAIGSAVGIGNIWRFPAVVGQNGGGAYLLPYLLAIFVFAVPLMILELAVGRHYRKDVVASFDAAKNKYRPLGWVITLILFLLLSYYLVITGWTLAFMVFSLIGQEVQFSEFITTYGSVVFFLLSAGMAGLVVSLGVRHGIERISTTVIPLSFVILIALVLYATTLSGFNPGIEYLFTPDLSVLGDPGVWSAAFGQSFFSLSVGFGILITYGAYLGREVGIPRASLIITIADLSVAMLAGMVIFPVVFSFGLEPSLGAELAFITLPIAFAGIPAGQILSIAFFSLLFFAGLTSAISMMEVNVTVVMNRLRSSRKKTTALLTLLIVAVGMFPAMSYSPVSFAIDGTRILDIMDSTLGTFGLPIAGIIISLVFSRYLGDEVIKGEVGRRWARLVIPITKYLVPILLSIVTLLSAIQLMTS